MTKEYISAITAVTKNIIVHGGIEDTTKNRSVVMKLLAVFAFSLMLIYASAGILPAVYDGPTYELGEIRIFKKEGLLIIKHFNFNLYRVADDLLMKAQSST